MLNRRAFTLAAGSVVIAAPGLIQAQSDTTRIVVGFPAGGVVDVVAREVAEALKPILSRTVLVENRPGAGGQLAVAAVKAAAPDILVDLFGGRLAAFVTALSNAVQPHRDGKMRLLLTTGDRRSELLPDVPTAREAGFDSLTAKEWFGLLAPAATPAVRTTALHAAVALAVASETVVRALGKLVLEPHAASPDEFAGLVKADLARWSAVSRALNYQRVDAS